MRLIKRNFVYMIMIVILGTVPLLLIKNSEFGGADGKAEEIITALDPNYTPWAESPIAPPGGETESLLFALQAAMGAGVVFYILGYYKGRSKRDN